MNQHAILMQESIENEQTSVMSINDTGFSHLHIFNWKELLKFLIKNMCIHSDIDLKPWKSGGLWGPFCGVMVGNAPDTASVPLVSALLQIPPCLPVAPHEWEGFLSQRFWLICRKAAHCSAFVFGHHSMAETGLICISSTSHFLAEFKWP